MEDEIPPPPPSPPRPPFVGADYHEYAMGGHDPRLAFGEVSPQGMMPRGHHMPQEPPRDQPFVRQPNIPINSNGKVSAMYEGFFFAPKETPRGQQKFWAQASKDRLDKDQAQLARMVRDKSQDAKKFLRSSPMDGNKRKQVDRLIDEHMDLEDPASQFEWEPAMINLDIPPGKSISEGRARSMTVIIKRIPKVIQLPRRASSGGAGLPRPFISDVNEPLHTRIGGGRPTPIQIDHDGHIPHDMGPPGPPGPHMGPNLHFGGGRHKYHHQPLMGHGPHGMPMHPHHGERMPAFHGPPGEHMGAGQHLMGPPQGHHMPGGLMHGDDFHGGHPGGPHGPPDEFGDPGHKQHKGDKGGKKDNGGKEGKKEKKDGKGKKGKSKPEVHQKIYTWDDKPSDSEPDSIFSDDISVITPGSSVSSRHERRYSSNRDRKYSPEPRRRRDSSAKGHREHKRRDPAYLDHESYVMVPAKPPLRRSKTDAVRPGGQNRYSDSYEDEGHKWRREQQLREEIEGERRLGKLEGKIEALQMVDREERVRDNIREKHRAREYHHEPRYRAAPAARERDLDFPRDNRYRPEPAYRNDGRYRANPRHTDPYEIFGERPYANDRYRDPTPPRHHDRYRGY